MKYCSKCGTQMDDNDKFCSKCGNEVVNNSSIPKEYIPITVGEYIAYQILFCIPIVGIICSLIFGLGNTENVNIKNFAKSYMIIYAIVILIYIVFGVIVGVEFASNLGL